MALGLSHLAGASPVRELVLDRLVETLIGVAMARAVLLLTHGLRAGSATGR